MLDVSGNRIDSVPANIHELANLSVLNVSRNAKIAELPPQMGLLYK
jgi:Leucine-rich repeat (LRR) protein